MAQWLFLLVAVAVIVFLSRLTRRKQHTEQIYLYKRKQRFLTPSEHKLCDALTEAVGDRYYVFPQVHLASLVDEKIVGQSWLGAFRHIDEKSVDFVLCDRKDCAPKLAIELDDPSHLRPDRQERDREVERVLKSAGLPLLRLKGRGLTDCGALVKSVSEAIAGK